jgi:hypothetical protein
VAVITTKKSQATTTLAWLRTKVSQLWVVKSDPHKKTGRYEAMVAPMSAGRPEVLIRMGTVSARQRLIAR